jgi:hypothetical protein
VKLQPETSIRQGWPGSGLVNLRQGKSAAALEAFELRQLFPDMTEVSGRNDLLFEAGKRIYVECTTPKRG